MFLSNFIQFTVPSISQFNTDECFFFIPRYVCMYVSPKAMIHVVNTYQPEAMIYVINTIQ